MADTEEPKPKQHWDFVDEDGCLYCNCEIGVIPPANPTNAEGMSDDEYYDGLRDAASL